MFTLNVYLCASRPMVAFKHVVRYFCYVQNVGATPNLAFLARFMVCDRFLCLSLCYGLRVWGGEVRSRRRGKILFMIMHINYDFSILLLTNNYIQELKNIIDLYGETNIVCSCFIEGLSAAAKYFMYSGLQWFYNSLIKSSCSKWWQFHFRNSDKLRADEYF